MLKNVALIALAAPVTLAFTPENLTGVWSCVPEDGQYYTTAQTALKDIVYTESEKDGSNGSHRTVVFDTPSSDTASRQLKGRTYYTVGTDTEEHEILGTMQNALQGSFHLAPNLYNPECVGYASKTATDTSTTTVCSTLSPATCLKPLTTKPIKQGMYSKGYSGTSTSSATFTVGSWVGSCLDKHSAAHEFVLDDADHFTLTVDVNDLQLHHWIDESVHHFPHVFVVEKCMRGLPEKNTMCGELEHSGITKDDDKDDACQGTLICEDIDDSDSSKGAACTVPAAPAPPVWYPQYQPQYYAPQYQQPAYAPYQSQPWQPAWGR